jgi:thiol-disulfide isomerase/thioredoxin
MDTIKSLFSTVSKPVLSALSTRTGMLAVGVLLAAVLIGLFVLRAPVGFLDASGVSIQGFAGGADSFTMYYADWCPHCKAVKPQFSNFAAKGAIDIKGKPVFVKMVEEQQIDKSKNLPIDGYPTFLLEKADGSKLVYEGERTAEGWKAFLEKNV